MKSAEEWKIEYQQRSFRDGRGQNISEWITAIQADALRHAAEIGSSKLEYDCAYEDRMRNDARREIIAALKTDADRIEKGNQRE